MKFYEWAFVVLNAVAFILMTYDKHRARLNMRRIPERLFIVLAILGGSAGVWFGMKVFRHKTKPLNFACGIPLIIMLQVIALLFISLR